MTDQTNPAFELLRSQEIPSLKIGYQEYRHRVTGAQHIHLASDNKENVFLVALRTVPEDSTGSQRWKIIKQSSHEQRREQR